MRWVAIVVPPNTTVGTDITLSPLQRRQQPAIHQLGNEPWRKQNVLLIPRFSTIAAMTIDPETTVSLHKIWDKVHSPRNNSQPTFLETVRAVSDRGVSRYRVDFITSSTNAYVGTQAYEYTYAESSNRHPRSSRQQYKMHRCWQTKAKETTPSSVGRL